MTQREEAFDWILQWLAQQPKSSFASHNYRHACSSSCQCVRCVRCANTRVACVLCVYVCVCGAVWWSIRAWVQCSDFVANKSSRSCPSRRLSSSACKSWCCGVLAVVTAPDVNAQVPARAGPSFAVVARELDLGHQDQKESTRTRHQHEWPDTSGARCVERCTH